MFDVNISFLMQEDDPRLRTGDETEVITNSTPTLMPG